MNKNYITITYKGLPINIECKNRILKGGNVYAYFYDEEQQEYIINLFNKFGINHDTINTPKTIGIVASVKDLIIGNKNDVKDDDELYRSIQAIRSTENLIICLKNQMHDNLSLIKTIIDNANELHDAAIIDNANDIEKTLNSIRESIKFLERRIFFAKPKINKKVLLRSQFNRHDFEVIVCIHVFIKNKPTPSSEFKCFANIGCYTDKSVIDEINSIHPSIIDSLKFCADIFLENKPEALEETKKLILEWRK